MVGGAAFQIDEFIISLLAEEMNTGRRRTRGFLLGFVLRLFFVLFRFVFGFFFASSGDDKDGGVRWRFVRSPHSPAC